MDREKKKPSSSPRVPAQLWRGLLMVCCLTLLGWSPAQGQQASFGNVYVAGGGAMTLFGAHSFLVGTGTMPGIVGTDRSAPASTVGFAASATWTGASDSAHVDGYVGLYGTSAFTFPIGDNGAYRPAAVGGTALIPVSGAFNTSAAYYRANPSSAVTSSLAGGSYSPLPAGAPFSTASRGPGVAAVSTVEYWHIAGTSATRITLTWNSASAVSALTGNTLTNLTIVGWNGATSRWEKVASTVDPASLSSTSSSRVFTGPASSLGAGSITTTSALAPNTYTVYTLGSSLIPTLSGRVFEDNGVGTGGIAHDGLANGTETGIGGVTLKLVNAGGTTTLATTQTAADGSYSFTPGTVTGPLSLIATPQTGWLAISEDAAASGGSIGDGNDGKMINIPVPTTAITGVNFGQIRSPAWAPDSIKVGKANTTVIHPHTFKAFTKGQVSFGVSDQAALPDIPGWSVQLLRDSNCNGQLDSGETPITGPIAVDGDNATVTPPGTVCVLARVTIPPGAAINGQYTMAASATLSYASPATRQATILLATDLTQVGDIAGLELVKATDKTTALPGEVITYTLTYRNLLTDPIKTIAIKDATPPYTTFVAASAICATTPLPAALTGCAVTKQPVANGTGDLEWTLTGTLQPGGTGQVKYQVRVEP